MWLHYLSFELLWLDWISPLLLWLHYFNHVFLRLDWISPLLLSLHYFNHVFLRLDWTSPLLLSPHYFNHVFSLLDWINSVFKSDVRVTGPNQSVVWMTTLNQSCLLCCNKDHVLTLTRSGREYFREGPRSNLGEITDHGIQLSCLRFPSVFSFLPIKPQATATVASFPVPSIS